MSGATAFTEHVGVEIPLICGAMYPCSNPELVAAVSAAGGIGVVQPISMTFVHGHDLRQGLRLIRSMTDRPIGFNAVVEKSAKVYEDRMRAWVDVALEEGVRFFVTALGRPDWVVDAVHGAGGVVYHDVIDRRFAERAIDAGVDGLICVNRRAGGHCGTADASALLEELGDLGLPLVCAGGVSRPEDFVRALDSGYAAVQMGTRFIATPECTAHDDYKRAIIEADADDIVHTARISGVTCSVIETETIRRLGTEASPLTRRLLRSRRFKHLTRTLMQLRSVWQLKGASVKGSGYRDVYQAGMSVDGVHTIEPAGDLVRRFAAARRG